MSGSHGYDTVTASARAKSATLGPVAANAVAPHAAGGATLAGGAGRSTSAGIDEAALLTAPSRKQSAAGRGQPQQPVRELSAGAAESAGEAEAAAQDAALGAGGGGHHVDASTAIASGLAAAQADAVAGVVSRAYHDLAALQAARKGDGGALDGAIDYAHKERHLGDADFAKAFNMDRAAFDNLPPWKQSALKKAAHLF